MREKFISKNIFSALDADETETLMKKEDAEILSEIAFIEGQLSFLEEHSRKFHFEDYSQYKFELKQKLEPIINDPQYGLNEKP